MKVAKIALASLLVLAAPACTTQKRSGETRGGEDAPRAKNDSELWEGKASSEISHAGTAESPVAKRRYYDEAISDLKKARELYENELADAAATPIPPGRKAALESEIDRLTRAIEQVVRDRPVVEPTR